MISKTAKDQFVMWSMELCGAIQMLASIESEGRTKQGLGWRNPRASTHLKDNIDFMIINFRFQSLLIGSSDFDPTQPFVISRIKKVYDRCFDRADELKKQCEETKDEEEKKSLQIDYEIQELFGESFKKSIYNLQIKYILFFNSPLQINGRGIFVACDPSDQIKCIFRRLSKETTDQVS